jgi:hypothetical protein
MGFRLFGVNMISVNAVYGYDKALITPKNSSKASLLTSHRLLSGPTGDHPEHHTMRWAGICPLVVGDLLAGSRERMKIRSCSLQDDATRTSKILSNDAKIDVRDLRIPKSVN